MSELRRLFQTHHEGETELARRTLTEFMVERAARTADEVGFKWIATEDAPEQYDVLRSLYATSAATGAPLPISSKNNEDVIYTSAEANIAFRFVHDVHHVKFGLSFAVVDELDLALWHLGELETEGFERTSMPWKMLHADLIGQAQLIAVSGAFPKHQRRFVGSCLISGFERGLIEAAREIERDRERL